MLRSLRLLLVATLVPLVGQGQVPMIGDDATVPAPGTARITLIPTAGSYDRRYSRSGDGTLEPLGSDFGVVGLERVPSRLVAQDEIRTLAGIPDLTLTLGDLDVRLHGQVEQLPLKLELGLPGRISLGVMVPFVRTRSTVVVGPGIGAGATAGLNPAINTPAALSQNTALVTALSQAAEALRNRLDQCAGSSAPDCASVNADRNATAAFATNADAFRDNLEHVYFFSAFVPVTATPAEQAIAARIAALRSQFESFGVNAMTGAPARPVGAAPMTYGDLQAVLTDPVVGISSDPLVTAERVALGDMEVGARIVLLDAIGRTPRAAGLRVALGGLVRLGTGMVPPTRSLISIGTGDGQTDIEGHAIVDAALGRWFAMTLAARYTRQLEHDTPMRIPEFAGQPFILADRAALVRRDLGDMLQLEATPRIALNEFFAVGGYFSHRRKGADSHSLAAASDESVEVVLDPAVLDEGTEIREQRMGVGVAFSNLAAFNRGRSRFPFELSFLHVQTTGASGGMIPRMREDRVQVRLYTPVWRRLRN
ncbi:hypothetical protein BH23GEM2_BH23GEM2_09490 [soil metagenome]